jgi:hypothetical protein
MFMGYCSDSAAIARYPRDHWRSLVGAILGHAPPPSAISEEATACLMPLRSSATTSSDQLGHRPATPSTRRHTAITW